MPEHYTRTKPDDAPSCPLNEGVICWPETRRCDRCGFNPVVAKARLEETCNRLGIELPEGIPHSGS